jgi:hypothetical protein
MENLMVAIKSFLEKLLGTEIPPGKPLPPHVANLKLHPDLLKLHMIKAEDYRTLQ